MRRLEGRTAVVTGGGTRGIGRATAARLVAEGAHVFITGRRKTELDEAVEVIGENVTAVPGDITDMADLDRLYEVVAARGQGLDVLFANSATASFATIETITEQDFDQVFGVNVKGTLFTLQKALPLLNEGASVIINASTAADRGTASFGAYAASKAALRTFTRTWANELKGRGVRVNAISPGPTDTSGITELVGEENATAFKAGEAARIAIGRMGHVDEVAAAVAFLASADSSFMLGANLYVDGGENQI
ncbi:SDR family oxidoreductase [Lentzea flaviverrucosa]|uniref:NAD(P)-dependent dehydrogenase, short-chain alcohol dehydrogenase family n=1 Tax=Lentzea flaviverrucosa TaxID=200379 RepID=A0A1H9H308_9PSEU|nr:SDR family oxidoreductase [Lentzea flaviverrucosa]RDI34719.1 NAD(P)-dependent dehydrogenase (short-subunit alcohol dehydrogenase family) [Lentzea flaviverrucosa]SEQ56663.1 NAD(P)-dependent dehydrogenase, short-chain alcohol dehydrogenase family [Lentzea flaviverrucosa]